MFEVRGIVSNFNEAKKNVEGLGGVLKTEYKCTDHIFLLREGINLSDEFVRIRVYSKSDLTKNVLVSYKKNSYEEGVKKSSLIFKKEFDAFEEGLNFIRVYFKKELQKEIEFGREGVEYLVEKSRVFVEEVQYLGPTVEVEDEQKGRLEILLKALNIQRIYCSLPAAVKQRLIL